MEQAAEVTYNLFEIICPDEFKDIKLAIKTIPDDAESLNGTNLMAFSALNANEEKLYKISQNKKTFIGSTESIVVYDVPAVYAYTSFMLLHELEHYNQYLDSGKKVYSYTIRKS